MGVSGVSEPHSIHTTSFQYKTERAQRRVFIKRALRIALEQWADGQYLYGPRDEEIGFVESRGQPGGGLVSVFLENGETLSFRIEVV